MNERKSSSAKRMNKVCILSAIEQFVKKNTVMVIALSAAVITMFFVPPDKLYSGYFDFKTLTCLFCVLAVVCVLKNINFFYMLARKIVRLFKNARMSVLALVYITFIGSMLIANEHGFADVFAAGIFCAHNNAQRKIHGIHFHNAEYSRKSRRNADSVRKSAEPVSLHKV